jgi:hypothetical protein
VAFVVVLASTGCATYSVQQSSLVPAPVAPPPATERGIADAYVGDATVTFVSRPKRAPNNHSGLWITRHLLQGALTLHFSELAAFRLTGVVGLHQGAMQAAPTTLENPGSEVTGMGAGWIMNLPFAAHALTLSLDLGLLAIPSYIEATCVSGKDCDFNYRTGHDRDEIAWAAATAGYAYRFSDQWRAQLGFVLQNHPTNLEQFESSENDAEVQDGPLYVTVALAVEWQPLPWLGLAPELQWPLTRSPVRYGPIVGLGVRGLAPGSLQKP